MTSEIDSSSPTINASQSLLIALSAGLLALGMYLWQLTVPEFISFYDSGVYMAAALHFVSGVLPYKDFTFVNPPGILLLMSPIALFSRIFGSHDGFILARTVTSAVTALNVSLLAWLVRHRGRFAMATAGFGLAVLPVAFFVSSALKLEPYCICFILLGALMLFPDDRGGIGISTRSFFTGGLLFGVAALIKLWAFFPFLAVVICLVPRYRNRILPFIEGAALGLIVPSLPFFLAAPRDFWSQVFGDQLFQKANPADALSIMWRLVDLTGFSDSSLAPNGIELAAALLIFGCIVVLAYRHRMVNDSVDLFLLTSAAITSVALLAAPVSSEYYGYFAAPFLVGVLAVSLGRIETPARTLLVRMGVSGVIRRFASWASVAGGVALVFALALYVTTFYSNFAWYRGVDAQFLSSVNTDIPKGACVVYDFAIYGIYSNRLQSNAKDCPSVVDAYGMWQSFGNHTIAPPMKFVAEWKSYFDRAQYVVLNAPNTVFVPWDANLSAWFAGHFHLISGGTYVFIYQRDLKH